MFKCKIIKGDNSIIFKCKLIKGDNSCLFHVSSKSRQFINTIVHVYNIDMNNKLNSCKSEKETTEKCA